MKFFFRSMCAVLWAGFAANVLAAGLTYTSAGMPDLGRYVPGTTTYDEVSADFGNPVQMGTDSQGAPASAVFYVPMQGDAPVGGNSVSTAASTAVKTGLFSRLSSGVGAVVQRIPGMGGAVAAQTTDVATAQTSSALTRPKPVWSCIMHFSHGMYERGTCSTINRPVGP